MNETYKDFTITTIESSQGFEYVALGRAQGGITKYWGGPYNSDAQAIQTAKWRIDSDELTAVVAAPPDAGSEYDES